MQMCVLAIDQINFVGKVEEKKKKKEIFIQFLLNTHMKFISKTLTSVKFFIRKNNMLHICITKEKHYIYINLWNVFVY